MFGQQFVDAKLLPPSLFEDRLGAERLALIAELDSVWGRFQQGSRVRSHDFHTFTLATVTEGRLSGRQTMILQGAEMHQRTFQFHLNARSVKTELAPLNSEVCCVFHASEERLRVRGWGTLRLHREDDLARAVWGAMSPLGQANYRTPIDSETTGDPRHLCGLLTAEAAFRDFTVCRVTISAFEWLRLLPGGARSARYEWTEEGVMSAQWLSP